MFAICPSCGEDIRVRDKVKIGAKMSCPYCDADLEVTELDPVELDWAEYGEDEEWDDDLDDDY